MKKKTGLILLFVLILPATLYFSFAKKHCRVPVHDTKISALQTSVAIQNWTTANGARVYFVETKDIPIIDIQVNFDAGSARDSTKPGLAALCVNLLNQGIPDANADLIAEKFEDNGALLGVGLDRDRSTISLRSLTDPKFLNPVITLFSDLIASPSFPDNNIEIQRNQILIAIKRNLQQPNVVASQAFFKALYQNHPYAEPSSGTIESVSSITKADLLQFYQQYFVAKNADITIVGGISKDAAMNIANQITQKLPIGNTPEPLPNVMPLTQAINVNIPFPSQQTHVLTGQPCATENDPDYFPLLVGNYTLGGAMLTSRLFKEIRNERGLVYNIMSAVLQLKRPAPFLIKLQTKNSQAKEAMTVLQSILLQFIKEGPTEQEIHEAKQAITRSFPIDISNNAKMTDAVSNIAFYQLPLDSLDTYQQKVEAVTIDEIKSAFQRRINPEKLGLIVVGTAQP